MLHGIRVVEVKCPSYVYDGGLLWKRKSISDASLLYEKPK